MERIWQRQYQEGVPFEIDIEGYRSIVDFLDRASAKHPDQTALVCVGSSLSFRELDTLSRAFASYLLNIEGLSAGDRVAIMLPNVLHYPIVVFGALRAGLTLVNVNPNYTAREVLSQIQDSGASLLVVSEKACGVAPTEIDGKSLKTVVAAASEMQSFSALAKDADATFAGTQPDAAGARFFDALAMGRRTPFSAPAVTLDDAAFLQYTGGTTGKQKAAVLTHRNIISNTQMMWDWFRSSFGKGDDCVVTILPIYHIMGLAMGCIVPIAMTCKNVLIPNPRDLDHFVNELREHRFTFMVGVNTLFNALLEYGPFRKEDLSCFRHTIGAGAQIEPEVSKRWEKLTGCRLSGAYGLTEASPGVCAMPVHAAGHSSSVGLPFASTDLKLLDEEGNEVPVGTAGEISIKGPQVMSRYWNRPEETQAAFTPDGFLRTGDIGIVDPDGFVRIVDRKKDLVLVSGFNVYPNEIEAIVSSHPSVLECACIGVPDEKTGEALKVFVVARDRALTGDDLQQFSRELLTPYKVPRQFEFVESLPKSSVGKVLRRELRA
jgi:long-chain acyl-CoA synthetase